ncbi:MAG: CDP-diacylglycerol--serine O-phosphatidyltransferase [Algoriphagus sp. 32-45-6]|nr:MAG: CDP-diacylglycerol--serine O-phosphatidyltransferase [Algoriphagus sp. 32-45-6]
MKIKAHIPNTLTLLNLAFGVVGIIRVIDGNLYEGAIFVLVAAVLDFLDGFVARLLKAQSPIGKELDSLADVVSFGVLPGIILFEMTEQVTNSDWLPFLTLIVPMLSGYRLAKFNLDTRQSDRFIGLPTPANALFISTLPFFFDQVEALQFLAQSPYFLVGLGWLMSLLLVAELPLIALKFKDFSFQNNRYRFGLIVLGMVITALFQLAGIPLIILAYIGLSVLENIGSSACVY